MTSILPKELTPEVELMILPIEIIIKELTTNLVQITLVARPETSSIFIPTLA